MLYFMILSRIQAQLAWYGALQHFARVLLGIVHPEITRGTPLYMEQVHSATWCHEGSMETVRLCLFRWFHCRMF